MKKIKNWLFRLFNCKHRNTLSTITGGSGDFYWEVECNNCGKKWTEDY